MAWGGKLITDLNHVGVNRMVHPAKVVVKDVNGLCLSIHYLFENIDLLNQTKLI